MAVKVIIKRQVPKGKETEVANLMRQMRARAMFAPGYISGETLRAHDDPTCYVVISTWRSLDDWKAWEQNPLRKEIQSKIDAILLTKSRHRVFDFA